MYRLLLIISTLIFSIKVNGQFSTKIQIGSAQTIADVEATADPLNAAQISVFYDINDNVSLMAGTGFMNVTGTEVQPWESGALEGRLVEDYYMPNAEYLWYPSFSSKLLTLNLNGIYKYCLIQNRFSIQLGGGLGIANTSSYIDLLDGELKPYDFSSNTTWNRDQLNFLYDGIYETRVDNLSSWILNGQLAGGIEVNINENLSLCADYIRFIFNTDYLDGIKYKTAIAETESNDSVYFISLGMKMIFLSYEEEDNKEGLDQ